MPKVGNQTPTYSWCSSYTRTQGSVAVALSNAYGLRPHPWQRLILDDWLAMDERGTLTNSLCLLIVSRQNGKTGCVDPRETYGLVIRGERILHTAQEYQTSRVAFDRLREKFGSKVNDPNAKYPELNRLVSKYTTSANQMVLDLTNGGHIEFRTRGSGGDTGRGGTFDLVVVDEAQSYTNEQDAAMSPLNSAAPSGSPQTILMGTVPDPARPYKGEVFARLRKAAREAPYDGLCIHEWSAEEIGDVLDEERWYEFNPSLGYQLLVSSLRKDSKGMSDDTFAREHLGWWGAITAVATPINSADWDACRIGQDDVPEEGSVTYAVKFSPDGSKGVVAACLDDGESPLHVEVAEQWSLSRGVGRFAEYLMDVSDFAAAIVIDGRSNAQTLVDKLLDNGVDDDVLVRPTSNQMIDACTLFVDATRERSLTHIGQEQLDEAARGCGRRKIGTSGGYGFESKDNADATVLEAVALAHWQASELRRDEDGEMMINL
jgi:hypothetical protein